jgi:hypothetical protein
MCSSEVRSWPKREFPLSYDKGSIFVVSESVVLGVVTPRCCVVILSDNRFMPLHTQTVIHINRKSISIENWYDTALDNNGHTNSIESGFRTSLQKPVLHT